MAGITVTLSREANERLKTIAVAEHRRVYEMAGYLLERVLMGDDRPGIPPSVARLLDEVEPKARAIR